MVKKPKQHRLNGHVLHQIHCQIWLYGHILRPSSVGCDPLKYRLCFSCGTEAYRSPFAGSRPTAVGTNPQDQADQN